MRVAVFVQVGVDRQEGGVVVAHREADRVAPGDVPVLLTAVELVLLLVELVHDVARASAGRAGGFRPAVGMGRVEFLARLGTRSVGRLDVVLDPERLVDEVARESGDRVGALHRQRRRGQVHVLLEQAGVATAGLPDLQRVIGVGTGEAVDPFPTSVDVVEAVVLLVDDDDVIDPGEAALLVARLHRSKRRPGGDRGDEADRGCQDASKRSRHKPHTSKNPVSLRLKATLGV